MASAGSGFFHVPRFLTEAEASLLLEESKRIAAAAPFARPCMGGGQPLNLTVTSAGDLGWWADRAGYRYVAAHPLTGMPWPPIGASLLALCGRALAACGLRPMTPDTMLINHYADGGSLGLHVDRTERDQTHPIVSLSLGCDAVFQLGGPERSDPLEQVVLSSGDLLVQSGPSRHFFHGIKKLLPTMGGPLKPGRRLNFTFRRVMP